MTGAERVAAGARHGCAARRRGRELLGDDALGQAASDGSGASKVDPVGLPGGDGGDGGGGAGLFVRARGGGAALLGGQLGRGAGGGDGERVDEHAGHAGVGVLAVALGADGDTQPGNASGPAGGHGCALVAGGKVLCWGNNRHGQLGRGTTSVKESAPAEVVGLSDVVAVAAGTEVSCAIVGSGGVRCWGRNDRGQLGAGSASATPSAAPEVVTWP
ncbi:MAG: hypothetical protein R3B70_17270 [Polyangiaceae bacterium]